MHYFCIFAISLAGCTEYGLAVNARDEAHVAGGAAAHAAPPRARADRRHLGVGVTVILTPPCVFCVEHHG